MPSFSGNGWLSPVHLPLAKNEEERCAFVPSAAEVPDKSPADFIDLLEKFYGATMGAVEAAQKSGRIGDLHTQLVQLANVQNKSTDGGTLIPAAFLRVTVRV
jgi:hypothetical protein